MQGVVRFLRIMGQLKGIILALVLIVLVSFGIRTGAGAWTQGQKTNWAASSRSAAAGVSAVRVGPRDWMEVRSGVSIEWFYVVTSGVSEIWPLAGGGVSGFKLGIVSASGVSIPAVAYQSSPTVASLRDALVSLGFMQTAPPIPAVFGGDKYFDTLGDRHFSTTGDIHLDRES